MLSRFTQTLPDDFADAISESDAAPLGAVLVLLFLVEVPELALAGAGLDGADAAGVEAAGAGAAPDLGAADGATGAGAGADFGAAAAVEPPALDPAVEPELDGAAPVSDILLFDFLDFVPVSAVTVPLGAVGALPDAGVLESPAVADFLPFWDFFPDVESAVVEAPAAVELPALVESADFFFDFLVELAAVLLAELSAAAASAFFDFFDFLVVVAEEL